MKKLLFLLPLVLLAACGHPSYVEGQTFPNDDDARRCHKAKASNDNWFAFIYDTDATYKIIVDLPEETQRSSVGEFICRANKYDYNTKLMYIDTFNISFDIKGAHKNVSASTFVSPYIYEVDYDIAKSSLDLGHK